MSNMKCPVCKTGTVKQGKYDKEYFCDNVFCPSYDETDSRTYDMLIRTRKALGLAKEGLKEIQDKGEYVNPIELAESYLDEIEALEQKD